MSNFKQKLSVRTQIALHRLIADVKEVIADNEPDGTSQWTGEFILSYSDERRYPRLIIAVEETRGVFAGTRWWTDDPDQGLTADEDLMVLIRG